MKTLRLTVSAELRLSFAMTWPRLILYPVLLLLGLSASIPLQAQANPQQQLDSLLLELPKAKEDTNKLNTLQSVVLLYRSVDYKKAITYGLQGAALAEQLQLNQRVAEFNYFLGNIYATHDEFSAGLDCLNKALEMERRIGDKEAMAAVYNNMASVYLSLGNYPKAIDINLKALKLFEEIGNKNGEANGYINIGYVYSSIKDNKTALSYNQKALALYTAIGTKPGIALALNNLGNNFYENGEREKSLEVYKKALALYQELQDPDGTDMALGNIAMSHLELKDYDNALKFGFSALRIAKDRESLEGMSYDFKTISQVYYHIATDSLPANTKAPLSKASALMRAMAYVDSAMALLSHLEMLKEYADAAELSAKISVASGNYQKAYEKYQLYKTLNDSLFNIEKDKKITQSAMQYDFDKKEAATMAEQEKKDLRQRNIRNSILVGLAGALLFLTIVYRQRNRIQKEKQRSEALLLNILPEEVAEELKAKGAADAKQFDEVTVMFTDFKGFTQISERMTPPELVAEIHACFTAFDEIISRYNIEKIKTIGDSYMCAGGLPQTNDTHAPDVVRAALEIQQFMQARYEEKHRAGKQYFEIRIGIHTGAVVAGIVGVKKFAYDIWGDTVNIASRMESSGEAGKVNISGATYALVQHQFHCIHRGKIEAKHKGKIDMYFVEGLV